MNPEPRPAATPHLAMLATLSRPRRPAESIDLGFLLARNWWRPIWAAWLITVTPLFVLVALLLPYVDGWGLAVLWWLLPVFDRVPLLVLSRCLAGEPPAPRSAWRDALRLAGWSDLLGALTWRRLDPMRALHLSMQRSPSRAGWRQRWAFTRGARRAALGLTAMSSLLQLGMGGAWIGLLLLLLRRVPGWEWDPDAAAARAYPWGVFEWLVFFYIGWSVIEPFYVAAGHALYLGQRTHREGWDVEIGLRRLGRRLAAAGPPATVLALAVALALGAGAGASASTAASTTTSTGTRTKPAAPDIPGLVKEIMHGPEFSEIESRTVWRPKSAHTYEQETPATPPPDPNAGLLPPLSSRQIWARDTLLAALLIGLLVRWRGKWLPSSWRRQAAPPEAAAATTVPSAAPPSRLAGLDVRAASLPADVAAAARQLWEEGQRTPALALLYRGAVAGLLAAGILQVQANWTEEDCRRELERAPCGVEAEPPSEAASEPETEPAPATSAAAAAEVADRTRFFAALTAAWQQAAYAARPPATPAAQTLWENWDRFIPPLLAARTARTPP